MSSRYWCATKEYRILFGKSSVITGCRNKLEDVWKNTSVVKTINGGQDQCIHGALWPEYRIVVNTIAGKSYEAVSHLFP